MELLRGVRIVFADGSVIERFRRRKTALLLAFLALHQKQTHTRDSLTDLIWPDLPMEDARNNLNVALSFLRPLLQDALQTDRLTVHLTVDTDVMELERTRNPDLYVSPLLPEFDPSWLSMERIRIESRVLCLLEARGTEADYRRLLSLDPTHETALRGLLTLLRSEGRHQELLRAYDAGVKALAELGLQPASETAGIVAGLRQAAPKKRRAPSLQALPTWPDPFFGRFDEIRGLEAAFASGARLVTLTGPGGMGKTRLSVEFARTGTDRIVYFVPLAAITDTEEAGEAILQTLNARRDPSLALWSQLAAHLGKASALLILDNFEQLPTTAARCVAQLMEAAPKLTCLITSRRRLEIAGEREVSLHSLPLPHAVGLFLQRARAVRPAFSGDPALLEQIVTLLDRMPLALEMAAARSLILDAGEILAALTDRIAFLRSRRADVEERHRSIEATLSWSWELLTPEQRSVLALLSVFHGGFLREAAEAVCTPMAPILEALETLCANSLVAVSGEPPRFHLLETIRAFSGERLPAAERFEAQRRHAEYFTARLESGASCRAERDNLRAASAYLAASDAPEAQLRFIAALRVQHWNEGFSETIEFCRPALDLAENAALPLLLRGRALAAYAMARERVEQGSQELFRSAASLLAASGEDEPLRAFVLQYAGTPDSRVQAEQVARQAGEVSSLAWVLTIQGNQASYIGDWDGAERYWHEALSVAVRAGDTLADFTRHEWSFYLVRRGEYVRSLMLLQEIKDSERRGNWNYPRLLMALGRYDRARAIAQWNVLFYEDQGAPQLIRTAYDMLAAAQLCLGDSAAARQACEQAEAATGTVHYRLRSEIALAEGESEAARHYAQSRLTLFPSGGDNFHTNSETIAALEALARAETALGHSEAAWQALARAMELRFRSGVRLMQCENLETRAALLARDGEYEMAALLLRASEEARLERSNPCLPHLRHFAAEACKRVPPSCLAKAPLLSLDAAVEHALR